MDIRKLQRAIVDGLEDVKGHDIAVFNTEHLSPLFERVIIASGNSNRQTKALAASVRDAVKASGHDVMRIEGEANGEWIIVDCGSAVVHLMQPTIREYYHLEEIWGGKPVKMKIGGPSRGLAKAEEEDMPPVARKKAATAKTAAKKAPTPAAAKKSPAKAAGKRSAPARPAVAKKAAPKAAAESARETSPSARKRPARQTAPVRTVKIGLPGARKTTARKTAAKAASPGVTRTVGVKRPVAAAKKAGRKT